MTMTPTLEELVRVDDPDFYLNDPFPVYDRMRREAPVYWYAPLRTWVLTRYEDIRHVGKTPELFSSASGIFLHDAANDSSSADEMFGDEGEQIGTTDPPRHRELRRIAAPSFTPTAVDRLRPEIEQYCDELVASITPGEPMEWVEAVAARLPIHTACAMLGLRDADVDQIRYWSDELERLASPLSPEEVADAANNFSTMVPYLSERFEEKRRCPAEDMISSLLESELDNEKLSEANVMMFTMTMLAAGNDTTRATLSGIAATLAENPGELEKLVADPSLVPSTIEEVMRWVTPARGFIRTVTEDTELGGRQLEAGHHVYLAYDAANRDPEIFENPNTFDITRHDRLGHVAFGYGTHVCIGSPIVRMETKALLDRLIDRFPRWEIAGPQRRTPTVLRSGWLELPVVFHEN